MFVLPTESFRDYVEHPQVRRMYLTDVGFFPCAAHHYRERRDGIEEFIKSAVLEFNGGIYRLGNSGSRGYGRIETEIV